MEKLKALPREDLISIAFLQSKVDIAEARAQAASAQLELADMDLKYKMLSIFHKLGIPEDCKIGRNGEISYPNDGGPIPPLPEEPNA